MDVFRKNVKSNRENKTTELLGAEYLPMDNYLTISPYYFNEICLKWKEIENCFSLPEFKFFFYSPEKSDISPFKNFEHLKFIVACKNESITISKETMVYGGNQESITSHSLEKITLTKSQFLNLKKYAPYILKHCGQINDNIPVFRCMYETISSFVKNIMFSEHLELPKGIEATYIDCLQYISSWNLFGEIVQEFNSKCLEKKLISQFEAGNVYFVCINQSNFIISEFFSQKKIRE